MKKHGSVCEISIEGVKASHAMAESAGARFTDPTVSDEFTRMAFAAEDAIKTAELCEADVIDRRTGKLAAQIVCRAVECPFYPNGPQHLQS